MALSIAITGGLCDGKSEALKLFSELGAETLSSDELAKSVFAVGSSEYNQLALAFPEIFENGVINRRRLTELIAGNASARRKLNSITHPVIVKETIKQLRAKQSAEAIQIVEVPLLIECGLHICFDRILCMSAGYVIQLERLTKRLGNASLAEAFLNTQLPTEVKLAFADYVVETKSSKNELREQIHRIWTLLVAESSVKKLS